MAILTVAQKITIAKINEYLISIAIEKGGLDGGGIDLQLPQKIRNIRKSIEYQYALNPSNTTLNGTSNYMLGMCIYLQEAQAIILNPGTAGGVVARTAPSPYQFFVDASTSFIIDGQSSKTITAFIGYNLIFVRGGVTQSTVDPGGGGSYYSWVKATASFTCYPSASTSELFQLIPV
jgi:hypothetical protein